MSYSDQHVLCAICVFVLVCEGLALKDGISALHLEFAPYDDDSDAVVISKS